MLWVLKKTVSMDKKIFTSLRPKKCLSRPMTDTSMRGSREGKGVCTPPPLKNPKHLGFLSNIGTDPLKSQSYLARFECWAQSWARQRHLI